MILWIQADPENAPGELIVYFYGSPGDYWVLDTDFDSFSSVYSCTEGLVDGLVKYEYAFILTREKYPTNETVRTSNRKCNNKMDNISFVFSLRRPSTPTRGTTSTWTGTPSRSTTIVSMIHPATARRVFLS